MLCLLVKLLLREYISIIRYHLVVRSSSISDLRKAVIKTQYIAANSAYSSLWKYSVSADITQQKLSRDIPLNKMQTRGRLHDMAHLPRLELESSIFKLLLHIAAAEVSQVAHLSSARAI